KRLPTLLIHVRHLIQIIDGVEVMGHSPDIADLHQHITGQLTLNAQVPGILHSYLAVRVNAEVEDFVWAVTTRYNRRRDTGKRWQRNGAAVHADTEGIAGLGCSTAASSADFHLLAGHSIAKADAQRGSHHEPDSVQAVVVASVATADHGFPVTKNPLHERRRIPGEGQAWLEITPFSVVGILPSQRFDRRKAKRGTEDLAVVSRRCQVVEEVAIDDGLPSGGVYHDGLEAGVLEWRRLRAPSHTQSQ